MALTGPSADHFEEELAGLDALEAIERTSRSLARRFWGSLWPKIAAIAIVLLGWQTLVWIHWKPTYVLAGPGPVFRGLWSDLVGGVLLRAVGITMQRAAVVYGLAVLFWS